MRQQTSAVITTYLVRPTAAAEPSGPFTGQDVKRLVREGTIRPEDSISADRGRTWHRAMAVRGLFLAINATSSRNSASEGSTQPAPPTPAKPIARPPVEPLELRSLPGWSAARTGAAVETRREIDEPSDVRTTGELPPTARSDEVIRPIEHEPPVGILLSQAVVSPAAEVAVVAATAVVDSMDFFRQIAHDAVGVDLEFGPTNNTVEPRLPLRMPAEAGGVWTLRRQKGIQIEVTESRMVITGVKDQPRIEIAQTDAARIIRLPSRLAGHGRAKVRTRVNVGRKTTLWLPVTNQHELANVCRWKAWMRGQVGNAAVQSIRGDLLTSALYGPSLLAGLQFVITLFAGAALMSLSGGGDNGLAAGIGICLLALLVSMMAMTFFRAAWGALVCAVICVVSILDTGITMLMVMDRLNGLGFALLMIRIGVLSSFARTYFEGFSAAKSARQFPRR